ncbi:MAG: PAS domain S-box protein [Candidatus Omnitrophica bacterium]|nr:PAS domain S-box protein [Candidatus Omnitrophota bacterium]
MAENHKKSRQELEKEVEELRLKVVELELIKRQCNWAEERLRAEKERAQMYLDIAGVIITVLDTKGRVILINKKGSQVLGYLQKEIIGKPWFDNFLPEKNREQVKKVFRNITSANLNSSDFEYYENPVLTKSGELRNILWHNTVIRDETGKIVAALSSGEDITEKKNAEEARLQNLEFYRSLIKASPDAIVLFDLDYKTIMVNQRAADLFDFIHKEEAIGRYAFDFISAKDRRRAKKDIKNLIKKEAILATEYSLIKSDGSEFNGEVNASIIRDAHGQIKALMCVVRDITGRKLAEDALRQALVKESTMQALQESKDYLDKIINSIADPIFVKDREHKWVLLNDAYCKFMGYDRDKLIGKSDYDYFPKREADIFWNRDEIVFGTGRENINEEEFTDSKGITHSIVTKKTLYVDNQGDQFIVGIIRDVTEEKKAEQERFKREKIEVELKERKESETKLIAEKNFSDSVINSMPGVFYLFDREGSFLRWNQNMEKITGYSDEEIADMSPLDFFDDSEKKLVSEKIEEVFINGSSSVETSFISKSGEKKPYLFTGIRNEIAGRICLVGVGIDIAEQKKAQALLKKKAEAAFRHQKILLDLAKIDCSDIQEAFKNFTETVSNTLRVERVSIWLFNEDYSAITCQDLYRFSQKLHEQGFKLLAKDYPRYFAALEESRSVAADDACSDLRTCEFKDDYLKSHGIVSMLDVPIRLHGKVAGIICHEHTGEKRSWSLEEEEFASSVADSISLLLAASKRREAEKALETSEATLEGVLRAVPIGIGLATKRILGWTNKGLQVMLGYSQEELEGKSARMLYENEEEYERVGRDKYGQIDKYGLGSVLTRWKRKDGSSIDIWLSSTHLYRKDPSKGVVFTAMDITDRIKAEKFLSESESKYRSLVENLNVGVFRNTPEPGGMFIHANPAMIKIYGYKEIDEFMKIRAKDLYKNPDDRDVFLQELKEKGYVKDKELKMVKKDGSEIIVSCTARAQFDGKGIIKFIDGISEDITARKKIEKSRIFTQFVVDHMSDIALWIDSNGYIVYVNEAATKELGYSKSEFLKKNIHDIDLNFPQEAWRSQWEAAKREKTRTFETRIMTKDKREFPVEISGNYIQFAGNEYLCAIVRDISERERVEEALRRSEHDKTTILNSLSELVVYYDTKMRILWANRATGEDAGVDCHKLTGKYCYEVWQNRSVACKGCPVKKALKTKEIEQGEVISDAGQSWFIRAYPIKDLNEKMSGVVEVALNTTQQKKAEKESKLNLERSRRILEETVMALAATAERRDPYTAGHQRRVSQLACAIAEELGLEEEQIEGIRMASIIHDVGKVYVPSEILSKPSSLTDLEFSIIKTHPQIGYEILQPVEFPWPVAMIVLQHHERLDGSGYPHGISSDDILFETKILTVADVVEAMASHRPYRAAKGIKTAMDEIRQNKDVFYDSAVVDVCVKLFQKKKFRFD